MSTDNYITRIILALATFIFAFVRCGELGKCYKAHTRTCMPHSHGKSKQVLSVFSVIEVIMMQSVPCRAIILVLIFSESSCLSECEFVVCVRAADM